MLVQVVVDAGDPLVLLEDEVEQRVCAGASKRQVAEEQTGGAVVGVVVAALRPTR